MADFRAAAAAGQCDIRWETLGRLLERVPSVTAVMGPTAGGSAARAVCAHFSLMSRPNGCLFGGGPPLVEHALGEKIDKFELGGHEVHTGGSGLIDNGFDTEAEAIEQIRRFLSYLPSSVHALPPVRGSIPTTHLRATATFSGSWTRNGPGVPSIRGGLEVGFGSASG